jgi:hypothetical protein
MVDNLEQLGRMSANLIPLIDERGSWVATKGGTSLAWRSRQLMD